MNKAILLVGSILMFIGSFGMDDYSFISGGLVLLFMGVSIK